MPERRSNGLDRLANALQLLSHRLQMSDRSERSVIQTGLGERIGRLTGRIDQIMKRSLLRVAQTETAIDAPPRPIQQRVLPRLTYPKFRPIRRTFRFPGTAARTMHSPRVVIAIAGARAQRHHSRLLLICELGIKAFDGWLDGVYGRQHRVDSVLGVVEPRERVG